MEVSRCWSLLLLVLLSCCCCWIAVADTDLHQDVDAVQIKEMPIDGGMVKLNQNGTGYSYWCVGNCNRPKSGKTLPGVMLMGGGTDVDKAFHWMIERSGGGDFVILRASGGDGYNSYVWDLAQGSINSVSTILITSKSGSDQDFVISKIKGASALFIAGGDQYVYIKEWNNTGISRGLQYLIDQGVTIGGRSSAGMAVMGQFIFTAATGGVSSSEALEDPYSRDITIGSGFLKQRSLTGVITDTHFVQRDRMGRLVVFLSRMVQDKKVSGNYAKGIACDEQTAVLVDESGIGTVVSNLSPGRSNYAYFVETTRLPEVCRPGRSLSVSDVYVDRVAPGGKFDVANWRPVQSNSVKSYQLNVDDGYLSSTGNSGSIY